MDDTAAAPSSSSKSKNKASSSSPRGNFQDEEGDEEMQDLRMGSSFSPARPAPSTTTTTTTTSTTATTTDTPSLSEHYARRSKTNDLFRYVFASVAGKKG